MSGNLTLPREQEAAETVRDELVDLKDSRAYNLVMGHIEVLLQGVRDSLERQEDVSLLNASQGQAVAYRRCLGMVDELIKKIDNTDYKKEQVTGGN